MKACAEIFRNLVHRADPKLVEALYREDYYPVYHRVGGELRPRTFLEIGVRFGYSMIALLRGTIDAGGAPPKAVGIDLNTYPNPFGKPIWDVARENLAACVPEAVEVELVKGDSHKVLKRMDTTFDLIHVDGDHFEGGAYADITDSYRLLAPGGTILVDDLDQPKVLRAFQRASKDIAFEEVTEIPHWHRLGVMRRR